MATVSLELPAEVCEKIREKFLGESESLADFVVRVFEELLDDSSEIQAQEEKFLEERLKSLGYLSDD